MSGPLILISALAGQVQQARGMSGALKGEGQHLRGGGAVRSCLMSRRCARQGLPWRRRSLEMVACAAQMPGMDLVLAGRRERGGWKR